jgi:hypothetical protein
LDITASEDRIDLVLESLDVPRWERGDIAAYSTEPWRSRVGPRREQIRLDQARRFADETISVQPSLLAVQTNAACPGQVGYIRRDG